MNDEIQFGEVEQAAPARALRPDENRHYAVAAYGEPVPADLPIYVDLDVLAEMEEHARSDTAVELGGVLLGGTYEDEQGRPFVVVTDSLRAEHYESTKGSFKFTHDTWAAITRQRDQFPAELKMVGWYHTHPDWGVFLSGMDMFICDNFFNKPLDVAYVIDPCRGDRGMFQWTRTSHSPDRDERVRRTGGFFVTASRFRATELENYVAELCGTMPATSNIRSSASSPTPIVHLHQPQSPLPPWAPLAVAGALVLQFMLLCLIAWRSIAPPLGASPTGDGQIAAALEKLDKSLAGRESRRAAELAEERFRARTDFLDEAFRELKGAEDGAISRLQSRFDQSARLTEDIAARDALIREMRDKLQSLEATALQEQKRLASKNEDLTVENGRLRTDLKKSKEQLGEAQGRLAAKTKSDIAEGGGVQQLSHWWWIGGGAAVALAFVTGVWWIGGQRNGQPPAPTQAKIAAENNPPTAIKEELNP